MCETRESGAVERRRRKNKGVAGAESMGDGLWVMGMHGIRVPLPIAEKSGEGAAPVNPPLVLTLPPTDGKYV